MTGYVLRRLLWLAPVLFFVTLITFVLMHLVPGGPWDTNNRPISPQLREQLESKYGLDEPVWQQFLTYSWNALHGDLGVSFQYQDRSVTEIIRECLVVSAVLGLAALAFALGVGRPVFGGERAWGLVPDWKQAILPTVTLGALPAAYVARITRASVLEVLQEDYVRTARAKGLHERLRLGRHVPQ